MKNRRQHASHFIRTACLYFSRPTCLLWAVCFTTSLAAANKVDGSEILRPNVLLIMTDDQGFGDIQSHGNPHLKTPHHDRLAASGARFERFFVSPVCAPTRASLLTGRYHLRTGVSGVTRGYENMRSEELTIAEVLGDAGYRTGCFGKWHNGRHMPQHPNGQGFDTFLGFCGGHWNSYFDAPLEMNGRQIETHGYVADVIIDAAVDFMGAENRSPWFCYVAINTPHSPWRVPEKYWREFDGMGLDTKAQCAYAMVKNIDDNLGRMLAAIEETNQDQCTIVLFLTDNGANSDRFNAGMKGRKGSVDEGGTRVPLFIRYPPVIRAETTVKPIAFHLDILPTLAELCRVSLKHDHAKKLDGRSLVPLLRDKSSKVPWPSRTFFTDTYRAEHGKQAMKAAVRTEQWRATMQRGRWRLYDMITDPSQTKDVADENQGVVAELSAAFENWFSEMNVEQLEEHAIPVGHPSRKVFQIPANEAELIPGYGSGIKYTGDSKNGYANSWIKEWTSPDAFPQWSIDVLQAGEYQVSMEYACDPADVGCELEFNFGHLKRTVTVTEPHVSKLQVKPDRFFSHNYQNKVDWGTVQVGSFDLVKGKQTIEIHIQSMTGASAIELKSVILKRVD